MTVASRPDRRDTTRGRNFRGWDDKRMTKPINSMTARKNLGELLEGVYCWGDEVIVARAGRNAYRTAFPGFL
jgi:hypothetical protein